MLAEMGEEGKQLRGVLGDFISRDVSDLPPQLDIQLE